MSLFKDEFTTKRVNKYISDGIWLSCNLFDDYMYLEYKEEGGYSSIHKVMNLENGEHMILKRSSKKDFENGCLKEHFNKKEHSNKKDIIINHNLFPSKEAEYMVKVYNEFGGVKLHDYYDDDDHYILIMKDGGRSLEDLTFSHKKKILELVRYEAYQSNFFYKTYLKQIVNYMIKTYHIIKKIHDIGIHHNDLKPENILINEENVIIIDYGVAKPVKKCYKNFKGTLEYIPYEYIINGSYKPWDHTIWCFGVMIHFLTLMQYPFLNEEDLMNYNLNYEKIDKLPKKVASLIYDCLKKDPLKRPLNLLERLEGLN